MHLKSLELHGFKSFSEKAALEFPGRTEGRYGITAIVGPNGSGKSNIVDAIRWVMGEQSMKTLRGKKGADVIFSGSAGKGKMGIATVVMTLDNRDGRMPIPYEEVIVSRRIDQSGESEYLVNGASVRLFDLQVLLAQAQFGHESYGTIGQGMIEQLIVHTPKERKEFFDEACGIKEFQIKRHQASLKLERVSQHMREAELLLAEITPRLKSLSRQVKKLEERQELERKLREIQESYYATLWHDADIQLVARNADRWKLKENLDRRREATSGIRAELDVLGAPREKRTEFIDLRREYESLMEEKQRAREEQVIIDTKLKMEPDAAGDHGLERLTNELESVRAKTQEFQSLALEQEAALAVAEEEARKRESESRASRRRREELRGLIAAAEADVRELGARGSVPPPEARAVGAVLAEPDRFGKVFGIVAQLARPTDDRFILALDVAAGGHLSSIVTEDDRVAERWIHHLRGEKIGIAAFLPKTLLKPRHPPQDIGLMLDLPGVYGLATDLVRFDERFRSVFSFVFGTTLIVESFVEARAVGIGRVRMVTMSGDLFEMSGSIKGGFRRRSEKSASFGDGMVSERATFLAEKEHAIAVWSAEAQSLEAGRIGTEEAERLAYRAEEQARARHALLTDRQRESEQELQSLSDDYALHATDPRQVQAAATEMRGRYRKIATRIQDIEASLRRIQTDMTAFEKREEEKQARMTALQVDLRAAEEGEKDLVGRLHACEVEIARVETKVEDIAGEVSQELREDIRAVSARGAPQFSPDELPLAMEQMQKQKYALSLIGGIDEATTQEYADTRARHEGLELQLADLTHAMQDVRTLIKELDILMAKKRAESFRKIRKEFARFFSVLFGGGKADLLEAREEAGEETQETYGIDVVAHPPGKKITHIAALSGGERTMTALALLAAILHTNPPPFVVLDEVEAALDEANTVRFGTILQELARVSQCILITHNRATMHIADTLYGVTMGGEGVSRLVSVKLPTTS